VRETPILRVEFSVARPRSMNDAYRPSKRGGMYLDPEVVAYKQRIIEAATVAFYHSAWPRNCFVPAKVVVGYRLWNYRGDVDGPRKALRDVLQGIFYSTDSGKIVADGATPWVENDGGESRLDAYVELYEVFPSKIAEKREADWLKRRLARAARGSRPKKKRRPRWAA